VEEVIAVQIEMATATTAKSVSAQLWYMAAVLCLTNAVAFIDRQSLPLLVDSIKADLQVTDTQMSYLIGLAFVLTYIGLGIPAGMLMDKYPRRVVMASGIALWSAATAWSGLVVSYWAMFIGRLGIGTGETVVGPGSISAIRDAFPEGQRNRAIGIWAMGANFGMATALLGGGAILAAIGDAASVTVPILGTIRSWQLVLICCALISLPMVFLVFTFPEPPRTGTTQFGSGLGDTLRYMGKRWRVFVPLFLVNGITIITLVGHSLWVPAMFGRVWHLSRPEIGFTLGIMTVVFGASSQFIAGAAMDWLHQRGIKNPIPLFGAIIAAISFVPGVFMPLAPSATIAWALQGLYMLIATCMFTIGTAFIARLAPPEMSGKITAVHILWVGLAGTAIGATIFAAVSDRFFQGPMALAYSMSMVVGVLDVIAVLFYLLLMRVTRNAANL
jgi:MFS family permease